MVNEDIVTALRNAVNRGEPLEIAINILINSGYNSRDVKEASKFVGGSILSDLQPNPNEQLTMPAKKTFFSKQPVQLSPQPLKLAQQTQTPQMQTMPPKLPNQNIPPILPSISQQQIQPEISQTQQPLEQVNTSGNHLQPTKPLSKELNNIRPQKPSKTKEIILLVILLFLIGILILTIVFKDKILGLFA